MAFVGQDGCAHCGLDSGHAAWCPESRSTSVVRPAAGPAAAYGVGDRVSKRGGDYRFDGVVVAAFRKLSGAERYVVEDDRGVLHVFSAANLVPRTQG